MTRMAEVRRELNCSYCVFVPDDEWDEFFNDLITSEPDLYFHNVPGMQKIAETSLANINCHRRRVRINDAFGAFVYLLWGNELLCTSHKSADYQLIDLDRVWDQEPDSTLDAIDETVLLSMI